MEDVAKDLYTEFKSEVEELEKKFNSTVNYEIEVLEDNIESEKEEQEPDLEYIEKCKQTIDKLENLELIININE